MCMYEVGQEVGEAWVGDEKRKQGAVILLYKGIIVLFGAVQNIYLPFLSDTFYLRSFIKFIKRI